MDLSRNGLERAGFTGFLRMGDLMSWSRLDAVPSEAGVYAVVRSSQDAPVFRAQSIGGHFKGKDPSLPVGELRRSWVASAHVVYVGKAGGPRSQSTLRSRLKQYIDFGCGKTAGHWGGRMVWQLEDCDDLLVAWKVLSSTEPAAYESQIMDLFERAYGVLPFANRRR